MREYIAVGGGAVGREYDGVGDRRQVLKHVHRSIIHNSQKVETIQMSIN